MKYKDDIIIILDSILDDYYLLWECFADYKQFKKSDQNSLYTFVEALKIAYENKYFNFFKGQNFNGDEELIPEFVITISAIEELLNYKSESIIEIRVTTSSLGVAFLDQCYNS